LRCSISQKIHGVVLDVVKCGCIAEIKRSWLDGSGVALWI